MTGSPAGPPDDDLERRLRDLGDHLVLGGEEAGGEERTLVAAVIDRLDEAGPQSPPSRGETGLRAPWIVAAAAAVAVLFVGVAAVAPAREAVAGWLGIGAVEIRTGDDPAPSSSPSTDPRVEDGPQRVDLEAVRRDLPFPLRVPDPDLVGEPLAAVVDPQVPTGLVAIRYEEVVLVQMASRPDRTPVASKQVGTDTEIRPVDVGGHSGAWITGDPHQVTYVLPDGQLAVDSVRVVGDVLVWEEDDITYRIEGARSLEAAVEIATSLR